MADAQASGACGSNIVWVQVPSPASKKDSSRWMNPFCLSIVFKPSYDYDYDSDSVSPVAASMTDSTDTTSGPAVNASS